MTDYKDTLNLPNTSFPMKANLAQREPAMLAQWQANDVYKKIRVKRAHGERFVLHDGPPYANGHLHCGHALNKILKDMIVKSKTLSGFDAPFVPGWDCHGLPVELNVEKKFGRAGGKLNPREFRQKCREYAASQIDIQRDEFQRLGVFGDWQNPYMTMNYKYEANVVRALATIIENGHIQQGFKPVHWCVDCGSALAEAEVDYEDKSSPAIDVAFYASDASTFLATTFPGVTTQPVMMPIWTTTPWTLPANEAVCLHPELEYALVAVQDKYIVIARELVTIVLARFGITEFNIVGQVLGQKFEHLKLKHPLYEREVPVVLGAHVNTESGTGCVHTAPAHGPDDYVVGQKYNLPLINPVLGNGRFAADVPLFAGLSVTKNEPIIEALTARGNLLCHETIMHSYPHCWRHKTPVIFLATPQWFISMDGNGLRQQLAASIADVKWVPDWGQARILGMVTGRGDWCISRQRAWGTPMPLFVHRVTKALHPDTVALIEQVALLIEKDGIDAWFELDAVDLIGQDAETYEKISDTLDVWFDSGVSHFCVLQQLEGLRCPADVYFEGSDQHRGWFNSSLTTSVSMTQTPPYKTVLTHGYTVDAEGKKLSKSKGNYVALDKLIQQHGADILRLWVASTDYRNEVSISEEIIKRAADAYRRIRNTSRFLLANLFDFEPEKQSPNELLELDRWIIKRCQQLQEEILTAYEQYHFHVIYQKIHNFCAVDLGGFYLDIIKDRQYTTSVDSHARRSCQTAMYHIVQALTLWLAPILSFTAEEIWQAIPNCKNDTVFLEGWYQSWPSVGDVDLEYWQELQNVRDAVNKSLELCRQSSLIGSALEAHVTIYASEALYEKLHKLGDELRFLLITSQAEVRELRDCPHDVLVNEDLGIAIEVCVFDAPKCGRCWHRCEDVGTHSAHPALCGRCIGNISGDDEIRKFV